MAGKTAKIYKGSDVKVTVSLIEDATKKPYSLAGTTGATGFFQKSDDTWLSASGIVISADLGKLQFNLTDSDTVQLKVGDAQSMEVMIDKGADRAIAQILERLQVIDRISS
jgi:hypothetical protein